MVEAGIRQEADHASASSRLQLLPHAFELLFKIGRRRMRRAVCILLALALRYVAFDFALVAQVEGNRSIHLLQAQRGVMRSDAFRGFAVLVLPHEVAKRHTVSFHVEAAIPAFDEFSAHIIVALPFSLSYSKWIRTPRSCRRSEEHT